MRIRRLFMVGAVLLAAACQTVQTTQPGAVGIEHATVVYAQPAKTLRLSGAIGPLQEFGVSGVMTWSIEPAGGGSRITLSYNVGGFADRPLADWAPIVDEVIGSQLKRLTRYITQGNPEAPKAEGAR